MTRRMMAMTVLVAWTAVMGLSSVALAADEVDAAAAEAIRNTTELREAMSEGSFLTGYGAAYLGAAVGAGLVVIGGAKGIARVGGSAVESMARQPEVKGDINVAMIITAAMIEGATLFAVVVCLLAVLK